MSCAPACFVTMFAYCDMGVSSDLPSPQTSRPPSIKTPAGAGNKGRFCSLRPCNLQRKRIEGHRQVIFVLHCFPHNRHGICAEPPEALKSTVFDGWIPEAMEENGNDLARLIRERAKRAVGMFDQLLIVIC